MFVRNCQRKLKAYLGLIKEKCVGKMLLKILHCFKSFILELDGTSNSPDLNHVSFSWWRLYKNASNTVSNNYRRVECTKEELKMYKFKCFAVSATLSYNHTWYVSDCITFVFKTVVKDFLFLNVWTCSSYDLILSAVLHYPVPY